MITEVNEETPPLEMIEILEDLKKRIGEDRDLHPAQYLEKDVRALYTIAHKHYTVDNYSEAEELFNRLVLARPLQPVYWKGLASSRQMQKNYAGALTCYGMCALLDETDISNHLLAAECLCHLNEIGEAKKALAFVKEKIDEEHSLYQKYTKLELWIEGAKNGSH